MMDQRFILKAKFGSDIRRAEFPSNELNDLAAVEYWINETFHLTENSNIVLKYMDNDGDLVTLASNDDYQLARKAEPLLYIHVFSDGNDSNDAVSKLLYEFDKIKNTMESLKTMVEDCAAFNGVEKSHYSPPASPVKSESIATIHPSSHEQVDHNGIVTASSIKEESLSPQHFDPPPAAGFGQPPTSQFAPQPFGNQQQFHPNGHGSPPQSPQQVSQQNQHPHQLQQQQQPPLSQSATPQHFAPPPSSGFSQNPTTGYGQPPSSGFASPPASQYAPQSFANQQQQQFHPPNGPGAPPQIPQQQMSPPQHQQPPQLQHQVPQQQLPTHLQQQQPPPQASSKSATPHHFAPPSTGYGQPPTSGYAAAPTSSQYAPPPMGQQQHQNAPNVGGFPPGPPPTNFAGGPPPRGPPGLANPFARPQMPQQQRPGNFNNY